MTQAWPLTWPEGWARTERPGRSSFKTTLPSALKNVQESLRRFASDSGRKLENVTISSNYTLAGLRPPAPGVAVYFRWDGLDTCIAVDRYDKVEDNLQAIHHCIEAERTKLRHGGLNLVRAAFRGYAALPPPQSAESPWSVLDVPEGSPASEIEAAYRAKAKKRHPDAGGSVEAFQALQRAREDALKDAGS